MPVPYKQVQKGILVKLGCAENVFSPGIFDLYSYRGIYENFTVKDRANLDLVGWYPVSMVNQANALSQKGRPAGAIRLYKRALLFPNEKPLANIYHNISLSYYKLKDEDNELLYLSKAAKENSPLLPVFERSGLLYYNRGLLHQSRQMLSKAMDLKSADETVKKAFDILNSMTELQMDENELIKANEYIDKMDLMKAMAIYDFLLEKQYKSAIIYRNIGVYYFRTNSFKNAIGWFLKSKNETRSAETYLYTAYTYFKLNNTPKAMLELEEGLKTYGADEALNKLYGQLKEQGNEKNTDSNHKQR